MTFADLQARVGRGVLRDDLSPYYGDYINEALNDIQQRRSFTCMKATTTVILPAGDTEGTIALAANFKELQPQPSVYFITDSGEYVPAQVVYESQQLRRNVAFWGGQCTVWPPRVFFSQLGSGAVIGMVDPRIEDFNFRVDYYAWLPALVNDTDTCSLSDQSPEMVVAKAKAKAFSDINDMEGVEANLQIYENALASLIRQDAYSEVRGRVTHM